MFSYRRHKSNCRYLLIVTWTIILLGSWGLITPSVWAKPATADQASQVVANWLTRNRQPLGTALGSRIKHIEAFRNASDQDLYYVVYLEPEGFVIVPGDDAVEPIIAFAPSGHFDPSEDNPLGAMVSQGPAPTSPPGPGIGGAAIFHHPGPGSKGYARSPAQVESPLKDTPGKSAKLGGSLV